MVIKGASMADKFTLALIDEIINKTYEYPGADPTSWSGFLEGTLNAIGAVINFGEGEKDERDTAVPAE